MHAIPLESRAGHQANTEQLFNLVLEVQELTNGYRFRLPGKTDVWKAASEFVNLERLCCPFFAFQLEIESQGGPIYLTLTGQEGVKPFIMAEIGDHLARYVQLETSRIASTF